ncbi:MAG: hypothetical protein WKF67_10765 [Rubrobacteraceae bacterium]
MSEDTGRRPERRTTSQPERENKWVERREDYALRFVPLSYRRWSWISLLGVMLGISTAMFFLAFGGQLAQSYGTLNLLIGMILGTLFIGAVGYFFTSVSSVTGLDSDLITRGAGFGFMGSAFTSLIYSFNFLIFSAFEGTIMANAIHARYESVPLPLLYAVIGLIFIPLTWYGLTAMNWVMWGTIPLYFGFLIWTIILVATNGNTVDFWGFEPTSPVSPEAGPPLLQLGAVLLGLITNATICADIGRFIPPSQRRVGSFALGFGFEAATFLGVTMLGAWLTLRLGGETDPGTYLAGLLGFWGVLFVVITQIRINVMNTYSGSLAYANFFARVFHFAPGRHWWVVLTAVLSTGLMFGGVYAKLTQVLTFEAVFVMAWIMAVVSDVLINKRLLGLSPRDYPYKRSQTYKYNPVGVGALIFALLIAVPMAFGILGPLGKTLAPYVSGGLAFAAVPVLAYITKGRYYTAPTVAENVDPKLPKFGAGAATEVLTADTEAPTQPCVKCGKHFELAEFVRCPFHKGSICSVCCAAEPSCGELCKEQASGPTPVTLENRRS